VQHPELDRAVARRLQRAGEDAAVGEPHMAAQTCGLGRTIRIALLAL
jgi:hypothetical protein